VQTGDVVRFFVDALRETSPLRRANHVVLVALARCRTAALGGHLAACDTCGHAPLVYHSCRNRHCPTCQSLDQHRWLEAHHKRVLPTRCFQAVFTLPEALRAIVRYNREALFPP
jgi:Transposase zinc-binding domain